MRLAACALALLLVVQPLAARELERWQKLDFQGCPMPPRAGPWSCVLDRQTGLVWENKSDNEGRHFEGAAMSWHDDEAGLGTPGKGSCFEPDGSVHGCDTAVIVRRARRERWCGAASWRVPRLSELESLLFDTGVPGAARIAFGYFPHTGRHVYWTSTTRRTGAGALEVAVVSFGSGQSDWLPARRAARLRLVAAVADSVNRAACSSRTP